jgi:hypothetical protein
MPEMPKRAQTGGRHRPSLRGARQPRSFLSLGRESSDTRVNGRTRSTARSVRLARVRAVATAGPPDAPRLWNAGNRRKSRGVLEHREGFAFSALAWFSSLGNVTIAVVPIPAPSIERPLDETCKLVRRLTAALMALRFAPVAFGKIEANLRRRTSRQRPDLHSRRHQAHLGLGGVSAYRGRHLPCCPRPLLS